MAQRAMRADALVSRARIIESARRLLAEDGDVHLNAVAKDAGLGQGTLYRHFPDRGALLAEVYRSEVEDLAESARRRTRTGDALIELRAWFDDVADYARVKRGVLAALSVDKGRALTAEHAQTIAAAIDELLEQGQREGTVREAVDAREVLLLLGFLSRIDRPDADELIPRTLDVIADGLRSSR